MAKKNPINIMFNKEGDANNENTARTAAEMHKSTPHIFLITNNFLCDTLESQGILVGRYSHGVIKSKKPEYAISSAISTQNMFVKLTYCC